MNVVVTIGYAVSYMEIIQRITIQFSNLKHNESYEKASDSLVACSGNAYLAG